MADRARLLAATLLIAFSVSVIVPAAALAVELAGESCPAVLPGATAAVTCGEGTSQSGGGTGGGRGFNLGGLLPIIGAAVGGAAIALVAAFLVFRRRASMPVAPIDPQEWWTCANCGRNNVIDSPRCYSCGSWRT
jgi:hypothetical protein